MWRGLGSLLFNLSRRQAPTSRLKLDKKTIEWLLKKDAEKARDAKTAADYAVQRAYSAKPRSSWTDIKEFITGKFIQKESPINLRQSVEAGRKNPKFNPLGGPYPRGEGSSYYRGTTLKPVSEIISKQPEMKAAKAGPGQFFSHEPDDALTYAMNREEILAGMGIFDNPGVIRRIPIKNAQIIENARIPVDTWKTLANATDAPISMVMSMVGRLHKMGWKDAKIFKYMSRIMKSGEKWKWYSRGGIASL